MQLKKERIKNSKELTKNTSSCKKGNSTPFLSTSTKIVYNRVILNTKTINGIIWKSMLSHDKISLNYQFFLVAN